MGGSGHFFLHFTVLAANLLAFSGGITLGWSSPILIQLQEEDNPLKAPVTSEQETWIGSLIALGACFGPFTAGYLLEKIGRKKSLIFCGVPYLISFLILAFATNVTWYYFARFISGVALGMTFMFIPMYVVEISEDANRGKLLTYMNLELGIGILFAYMVGSVTTIKWFCLISAIFPMTFLILFSLLAPESPYYLMKNNEMLKAENSLCKFRTSEESELKIELAAIRNSINSEDPATFGDLFNNEVPRRALLISLILMGFQQLTGINVILFYIDIIFKASGSSLEPAVCSIIIGAVQVLGGCVVPVFVDRLGRRLLLMLSGIGMTISEFAIAFYFYKHENAQDVSVIFWLPVSSLVVWIFAYCIGFGPLPWTIMAEIMPGNVKSKAGGIAGTFCWFVGFMLTKYFALITEYIHMSGGFGVFTACNVGAVAYVWFKLPETKGKSLQEIQTLLKK